MSRGTTHRRQTAKRDGGLLNRVGWGDESLVGGMGLPATRARMGWQTRACDLRFPYGFSVDNRISLQKKGFWVGCGTFVLCFSTAILDTCKS